MKLNHAKKILLTGFVSVGLLSNTIAVGAEELTTPTLEENAEKSTLDHELPKEEINSSEDQVLEDTSKEKESLEANLANAQTILAEDRLVPESKELLEKAVLVAKTTLEDEGSSKQALVDADEHLTSIISGLHYYGDVTDLRILVSDAGLIDQSLLTEESAKVLNDAIDRATLLLSGDVPEETVKEATLILQTAMENLEYLPVTEGVDTAELKKAVQAADKISIAHKTEYTKTRFLYALDNARAGLSNPDLSQSEVNALVTNLKIAQGNLESLPGVEEIIEEVPNDYVQPTEETEVLPSTGMGALGLMTSHSMIVAGLSMIVFDKKKQ